MVPAAPPPRLVELAHAHGVATEYWDWQGQHVTVSAAAIRAVLTALGIEAEGDDAVERGLVDAELAPWRRTLPATVVAREGWTPWVHVHVPAGTGVRLDLVLEDGTVRDVPQVDRWVPDREVDGRPVGEATFEVPGDLPVGWHRLVAHLDVPAVDPGSTEAVLVVTPQRLSLPPAVAEGRVVGLTAQLYQVRSAESWGVGDLGDLADLATWAAAAHDADFVLINPLHAAEPVAPMEPSPYLPTTRRFVNPLYLRVEDVPELARLEHAAYGRVSALAATARALDDVDRIDRDAAWAAKKEALRLVFDVGLTGRRERSFAEYREREGDGLTTYATWCALVEEYGLPWSGWADELQDPSSAAVSTLPRAARRRRRVPLLAAVAARAAARDACSRRPSPRACRSASCTTSPSGCTPWVPTPGGWATRWPGASPSAPRRTSSTSSARTGASRRGARTGSPSSATPRSATWCARCSATPAASGSTTSSGCSGCGGSPRAARRPRAPTCTTTTRRCSASSCSRRSGPARSSSARTSASSPRTCATT